MTYQPQPNGNPNGYRQPQYQNNAQYGQQPNYGYNQQNQYGNNPYYQQPYQQSAYMNPDGSINAQVTSVSEKVQHTSMTRAYGEMTLGLLLTAVVAILTSISGAYLSFLQATGTMGVIILAIVQVGLAIYLSARIMKMSSSTARVLFYVYAALMGVTLSTIFNVYSLGSIGIALLMSVGFFFALTMFGLTTKADMLKAGPILLIALVVFIIGQVLLMIFAPGNTSLMLISAIGVVLFAGLTIYDAQFCRQVFAQYANQGEEAVKKISILCALNLYLDFINMFLYILRLVGNRD